MKLRNKKTGEIVEPFGITCVNGRTFVQFDDGKGKFKFVAHSLAELNAEWEDVPEEEPKEYWFIDADGEVRETNYLSNNDKSSLRNFGNYFETKEEAEKAVERLRAWERLKDKGFRFIPEASYIEEQPKEAGESIMFIACTMNDYRDFVFGDNTDIKLLFSQEDD